jgi:hypothetical protein
MLFCVVVVIIIVIVIVIVIIVVEVRYLYSRTPLSEAVLHGHTHVIPILKQAGAIVINKTIGTAKHFILALTHSGRL